MKIHNYDTELAELLDCPFCGGRPIAYLVGNDSWLRLNKKISITVKCKNCSIQRTVGSIRQSIEWLENKAIELWNTRVDNVKNPPTTGEKGEV